jgi:hypothetical protein
MNKKLLIGIGIVLLVVVVFVAGLFFWNSINPNTIKKDEKAEVTALVETFGSKLKEVRSSDPEGMVSQEIKQVYAPFVSSNFLLDLINDPSKAPGGAASSPWPEKIEIISMEKLDSHTIQVKGKIILMTSVEMTQGGNAGEMPIVLWVRNTNVRGAWLIDQLSFGDYAFYDGKELYNILKNAFPNMGIIGGRGEPFVAQSIDITGDYIPEAIVDMQIGGAYTEYYTVCRFVSGKLEVAQFKDENGNVSTMFIYEGASVQHEVKLSFINDGKGNHAIYQYTVNKSASDPTVISTITVEAYKWNEATKLFEYNEELSIEFEQEEEKLLMPKILAFSSLKYKEIRSSFPIITSVSAFNGKVTFATGTGKIIVNDFKAANTNHLVIYDAQSGRLEYSTSIDKSWARISGVQINDNWVLFEAMEDPGEIPSECFAINRSTDELIRLLPNYDWGEKVSPDTTVFTVFDRILLQGDYAYLVIMSEDMVASGSSTVFRGGAGGTRFIRVNLKDGKQDSIFTPPVQSFSISQLWALDNDSIAFGTSEVMADGDTRDQVYFYDPSTTTLKPIVIDQWKDSSDPRYIGTYTITPDKRIIYSSNNKIVIAPVATLSAFAEVGITESNGFISGYIVASDNYLVARLDNGDIFVFNRKTGERAIIKGANVASEITINADEICYVHRQEKANDSIIYLDLKEIPGFQPLDQVTDSTGDISTNISLPKGISGRDVYAYLQNNIIQPVFGGHVFCAYTRFGSEVKDNKTYIYLWALCAEYRLENGKLTEGTGRAGPLVLIATSSQQSNTITEHLEPENGTGYAPSIKKMFPTQYYNEMSKTQRYYTVIAADLNSNVEAQAKTYYNLR